ncbi:MAG: DNA phosphorothioation-associated putative methyltransferase [Alphaproteobacteria bacterium]|nr:DNA phosphorothioation-associated putative methyltransferase [Alphaproteobacteria bacterium]
MVGKKVGGFLYIHRSAQGALPEREAQLLARAEEIASDDTWNVAKIAAATVSLLVYEDFDSSAFPALIRALTIDLANGTVKITDYSAREAAPILHRKELLLLPDDPRLPTYRAITSLAEDHGLFADTKRIGTHVAWAKLVEGAGLEIRGASLRRRGEAEVSVLREKTAIVRPGLSAPMGTMIRLGMIRPGYRVFDYGCGHGGDLEILSENGFEAFGWDPAHLPHGRREPAEIVNLGFVVNVIENKHERAETLRAAWSFASNAMTVSAMLLSKADVAGQRPHGDGFLTSRSTFQKYFTQEELLDWVSDVLDTRSVSLGPGIVAVFRDQDLEQEALFARRSRTAALTERYSRPRRERVSVPRPDISERISGTLQDLWSQSLRLGRFPTAEELEPSIATVLAAERVSLRRALEACGDEFDTSALETMAEARRDDLLVFGALSLFPGAPRYSGLPPAMQRDVRHFFGSHAAFIAEATHLLSRLRNRDEIEASFRRSAESGNATLKDGVLSFSMANEAELDVLARVVLGCAELISPGFSQVDAVDIGPDPSRIVGYVCLDFGRQLPRLVSIRKVSLSRQTARNVDLEDGVLYGKGRFMSEFDEGRAAQLRLDERLENLGLVDRAHRGPSSRELSAILARAKQA